LGGGRQRLSRSSYWLLVAALALPRSMSMRKRRKGGNGGLVIGYVLKK
jgi:hypothetical protein